jgi:gliding motility-associated-like protein
MKAFIIVISLLVTGLSTHAQNCTGSLGDPIADITFGAGAANPGPALAAGITNLQYVNTGCPNDGQYTISNYTTSCWSNTWQTTGDHTGNTNGYFMLINASVAPSDFYVQTVDNLCSGTTYYFAAWIMNLINNPGIPSIKPNVTFTIETTGGNVLQVYSTGDIPVVTPATWVQYGFYFTIPAGNSSVVLRLHNNAPGGGGNDLALDDITFSPAGPAISVGINGYAGNTATICSSDNTPLTLHATVDSCYISTACQWQQSLDNGTTWTDINGATNTTYVRPATPVGTYLYRLMVAQAGNIGISTCRAGSANLTVNVVQSPTIGLGIINNPGCTTNDGSIQITGLMADSVYQVSYSVNGNVQTVTLTADQAGDILLNGLGQGTYADITVNANNCTTNAIGPVTLHAIGMPDPFILTSSNTVCEYGTLNLYFPQDSVLAGENFFWQIPNNVNVVAGNVNSAGPLTLQFNTTDSTVISFTVTNGVCDSTVTKTINILSVPDATIDAPKDICPNDTIVVAVASVTGKIVSYSWNFGSANIISDNENSQGPYKINWNTTGAQSISLTFRSDSVCNFTRTVFDTVMIHTLPDAYFLARQPVDRCAGDSIVLSVQNYQAGNKYTWAPKAGIQDNNARETYTRITFSTPITLTVTDPYGCNNSYSANVDVNPCCDVYMPNAFTPNGDALNDIYRPVTNGHQHIIRYVILNRWGQTVFETADQAKGWDGTLDGTPQEIGVYFYYLKYQCSDNNIYEKHGDITLVR